MHLNLGSVPLRMLHYTWHSFSHAFHFLEGCGPGELRPRRYLRLS